MDLVNWAFLLSCPRLPINKIEEAENVLSILLVAIELMSTVWQQIEILVLDVMRCDSQIMRKHQLEWAS